MKDMIETPGAVDDIDRIVNGPIESFPETETVTSVPRAKLLAAEEARKRAALSASADDDPEEFWDNFPV